MCNFIKSNGQQCKLAPKKELCHLHAKSNLEPIKKIKVEFEQSNIAEPDLIQMPPQEIYAMVYTTTDDIPQPKIKKLIHLIYVLNL